MIAAARALKLNPDQIDYINAHATSTPVGDPVEITAVKALFGAHAHSLAMSSTKSATGHLLGAAGAVEAIFTVLALRDGVLPPTLNLHDPDPDRDLDSVPHEARPKRTRYALSVLTLGFGGTNAALIFRTASRIPCYKGSKPDLRIRNPHGLRRGSSRYGWRARAASHSAARGFLGRPASSLRGPHAHNVEPLTYRHRGISNRYTAEENKSTKLQPAQPIVGPAAARGWRRRRIKTQQSEVCCGLRGRSVGCRRWSRQVLSGHLDSGGFGAGGLEGCVARAAAQSSVALCAACVGRHGPRGTAGSRRASGGLVEARGLTMNSPAVWQQLRRAA